VRFYDEGKAEYGDPDLRGPVPVAVAGTLRLGTADAGAPAPEGGEGEAPSAPGTEEARIAVFGDSDFATNELIEAYRNRDLFVNTVNWLIGDVEAISIRPVRSRASRFELSAEQFLQIRSLALFVLPEAIAIAGVLVWWTRRRAPSR
jgi:ABC-type uncharacterized transport system involved in gliding motility auxiliary subunit